MQSVKTIFNQRIAKLGVPTQGKKEGILSVMGKRDPKTATYTASPGITQSCWEHVRRPLVRFLLKRKEGGREERREEERERGRKGGSKGGRRKRGREKNNAYENVGRRFKQIS